MNNIHKDKIHLQLGFNEVNSSCIASQRSNLTSLLMQKMINKKESMWDLFSG